jgi:poly(3-hydroxybutyrate) depolymerase
MSSLLPAACIATGAIWAPWFDDATESSSKSLGPSNHLTTLGRSRQLLEQIRARSDWLGQPWRIAVMIDVKRGLAPTWRSTALVRIPSCLALIAMACGCTSTSSGDGASVGGSASSTSGGSVGGANSAAGAVSKGGANNSVAGGTFTNGGANSAAGGTFTNGGAVSNGGANSAAGGAVSKGGASSAAGGKVSNGGANSAGGLASGRVPAAGGRSSSGGAPSTGGVGSGGVPSTGGTSGGRAGSSTTSAPNTGESAGTTNIGSGGSGPVGGANGSSGAVPSSGCGKTSTMTFTTVPGESGTSVGTGDGGYVTIQSSGQSRGFAMRLPANYDKNKTYPLFFGFHWNGGTSKDVDTGGSNGYIMAHFGLQSLSKNGAIFVAPQGLGNAWPNSGGQDLTFVDDMVKLIEDNYCVDTTHLFANGFSYGGGMTYAIACARAKVFRGAAIYEGAVLSGCSGGTDPIALWQMAGLTDTTCTIDMATPMRDKFAKNNGCTIPAAEPSRPPQPPPYLSSGGHVCTDYSGCSSGHPLRWCVHQSGHGNAIVDGTADLYNSCATSPKTCSTSCPCTWVPQDVWSFFTSL